MNAFDINEIIKIHNDIIKETGGIEGVRDKGLLNSALNSPFQTFEKKDLYPNTTLKAAQLCYSLIENHPFMDGNKRTGLHVALVFLELNDFNISYSQQELVDLGLNIASGNLSANDIKDWFENHRI